MLKRFYQTSAFRSTLLKYIAQAKKEIFITALYLEHDEAGEEDPWCALHRKQQRPELSITVIADRAPNTWAYWCLCWCNKCRLVLPCCVQQHLISRSLFTVFPNTREALGVLHLKGFIFDDTIIYSGEVLIMFIAALTLEISLWRISHYPK